MVLVALFGLAFASAPDYAFDAALNLAPPK
jgi:hypothetical protein